MRLRDLDWWLLGVVLLITVMGVAEIHSATLGTRFAAVWVKQVYFAVAGLVLLVVASQIDYKLILEASPWLYGVSVAGLAAVLVLGKAVFHSRRWIPVAGSHLQVSEFVKLVIIVVVARYCGEARLSLTWSDVGRVVALVGLPAGLVLLEPDLGTALTYVPIAAMGLVLGGMRWRQLGLLALGGLLMMPLAWHEMHPYQRERLVGFMEPQTDPLGRGYQVLQSKIAVGAGGMWGQGMAQGSQTRGEFLPVPHTDFIFAAFAEEYGFAGGLLLLGLYLLLLMRLIHNAQLAPDRSAGMVVMGVVAVLAFHVLINVGMVVGLMPVTGIPLPLMSSGGSSLLFTFAALGLVMNIRRARFVN
ncbi:MAG TPA: rod shape-determining protein RodA [Terriglobales bacterium]|nr:rod shape-determining protein RodA [Terriglobales bacterium]